MLMRVEGIEGDGCGMIGRGVGGGDGSNAR